MDGMPDAMKREVDIKQEAFCDCPKNFKSELIESKQETFSCSECSSELLVDNKLDIYQQIHEGVGSNIIYSACSEPSVAPSGSNPPQFQNPVPPSTRAGVEMENKLAERCSNFTFTSQLDQKDCVDDAFEIFRCTQCDFFTNDKNRLDIHWNSTDNIEWMEFSCPFCQYTLRSRWNFDNKKSLEDVLKMFRCDNCDFSSSDRNRLNVHVMSSHSPLQEFRCSVCLQRCNSIKSLIFHINFHNAARSEKQILQKPISEKPISEKLLKCPECTRRFGNMKNLVMHKEVMHSSENTKFSCKVCNHKFITDSDLLNHVQQVHPYECHVCHCSFKRKSPLTRHLKNLHSVRLGKPYCCGICQHSCNTKWHFYNHMKQTHLEKK